MIGQMKNAAKKQAVKAKMMRAKFFDIGAQCGCGPRGPARRKWRGNAAGGWQFLDRRRRGRRRSRRTGRHRLAVAGYLSSRRVRSKNSMMRCCWRSLTSGSLIMWVPSIGSNS
jgi:hypothetical protein